MAVALTHVHRSAPASISAMSAWGPAEAARGSGSPGGLPFDERELAERARTDRAAFGELYRLHVTSVYRYAYRICGSADVAEEVTSATFERALRAMPAFEWRGGGFKPWVLRIAASEAAGFYRKQQRPSRPRGQMAMRALALDGEGPPEDGFGAPAIPPDVMRTAIAALSPRHREAVTLRYLAELSPAAAAAAMGCSKATLAVTLHRALGALRRGLAESMGASMAESMGDGR